METKTFSITREKHLDHMVRVVPFIVMGYAIQSYVMLRVAPGEFSQICLSALGATLALMIAAFIYHDLKHQVIFLEHHLEINFLLRTFKVSYHEIASVEVHGPEYAFSNLTLKCVSRSHTFYFVDDAEKIKTWIENKKYVVEEAA
jgi:hypothetical protein